MLLYTSNIGSYLPFAGHHFRDLKLKAYFYIPPWVGPSGWTLSTGQFTIEDRISVLSDTLEQCEHLLQKISLEATFTTFADKDKKMRKLRCFSIYVVSESGRGSWDVRAQSHLSLCPPHCEEAIMWKPQDATKRVLNLSFRVKLFQHISKVPDILQEKSLID